VDLLLGAEGVLLGFLDAEGFVVGLIDVDVMTGGDETGGVDVVEVDVETPDVVVEVSLKERYQFVLSVSPRHSPTVTPFQPLALMTSK